MSPSSYHTPAAVLRSPTPSIGICPQKVQKLTNARSVETRVSKVALQIWKHNDLSHIVSIWYDLCLSRFHTWLSTILPHSQSILLHADLSTLSPPTRHPPKTTLKPQLTGSEAYIKASFRQEYVRVQLIRRDVITSQSRIYASFVCAMLSFFSSLSFIFHIILSLRCKGGCGASTSFGVRYKVVSSHLAAYYPFLHHMKTWLA